jgi:type I restriction enzyme M protein
LPPKLCPSTILEGVHGVRPTSRTCSSSLNPQARLEVYGQELNDESYAICKADMLVKCQAADNVKCGNSFSADGLPGLKADYLISNPPFGVDWSKAAQAVLDVLNALNADTRYENRELFLTDLKAAAKAQGVKSFPPPY